MTKAKTVKLTELEMAKIANLENRKRQLQMAGAELSREYKDTLELIGDRHGLDLVNKPHRIEQDGSVVASDSESQSEGAKGDQQQLNG